MKEWLGENEGQTGLTEGFVVEACFSDCEGVPFFAVNFLVDVDDIEVFVLDILS
jgi:hypothetical protein